MTIKAILTPYFAMPLSGGTFFVQQPDLPRNDKQALEMHVASTLLSSLPTDQQANIQSLRSNTDDPPDVFIDVGGQTLGIEIAELVPRNQHGKDAVLDSVRNHILERLILGESTRNRVVFLHTHDAHADKLKLKGCAEAVAALLNKELASHRERWFVLPLPAELQPSFRAIIVETYDLSGHPQVNDKLKPLIVFDAEATYVVPEEDFPQILSATVGKKLLHDLAQETWLLVWTDNQAMSGARKELYTHTQKLLTGCNCKYSRAFLVTFGPKNEVMEVDLSNRGPA
jgi:hypothetical protein